MYSSMGSPLLIALPQGLGVSGVNLWAVRLAEALAGRGRPAALLLHREPPGHMALNVDLPLAVERIDLTDTPPLNMAGGDLSPWVDRYRDVVRRLADDAGAPVILSPNLLGDCYGIAATLCRSIPESLRVVGWHHSSVDYNDHVLGHYEPIIARFVAVSDEIADRLGSAVPHRAADIVNIPYGVPIPRHTPQRAALANRPVRLLYIGRIDHEQKRVLAFAELARELTRRGVDHELVLIGDGPASSRLDGEIVGLPTVHRLAPVPPATINRWLDRSDALLLASRYEGLSVSMLEAMARGCVPIVTRVESGVAQAIDEGVNGELADACLDGHETDVGRALADAVGRFLARPPGVMALAAWKTARDRFSIERHADAVDAMLDEVGGEAPRRWPANRPAAFTARDDAGGTGSVPPDGARRLASVLERLGGRRIVVHGTGEHTRQLADVLASAPVTVVAFSDDDRLRQGSLLWDKPIVAPRKASETGATDVVISSWINQQAIWSRRAVYEQQGMTVHTLYEHDNGG